MNRLSLLAVFLVVPQVALAQALPFHTETALTTSFEQRGLRGFVSVGSRGDLTSAVAPLVLLPFAPHQRVTTAVVLPFVYKRDDPAASASSAYSNAGLGDVTVKAKWAFFAHDRLGGTTRLAVILAARLPTGSTGGKLDDGTPARRSFQLGTGSWGGGATFVATVVRGQWAIVADLGHQRSAANDGFTLAAATRYNLAVGLRLPRYVETIRTRTVQLYMEWNGTISGHHTLNGASIAASGGHVAFFSPGVQWVFHPQILLEGSLQIPVVQNLNGTQPEFGVRGSAGLRFLFF